MSSIALHQGGLLVADGLLGANALATLRDHVAQSDYRGVHGQKWDRVWRLWDGNPQRGPSVYYDPDGRFDWKGPAYPTGTVVDQLIDAVRTLSALHPDVAGAECVDWAGIYLCPWLYPVGAHSRCTRMRPGTPGLSHSSCMRGGGCIGAASSSSIHPPVRRGWRLRRRLEATCPGFRTTARTRR